MTSGRGGGGATRWPSGVYCTQCPGSNTPAGAPGADTNRSGTQTAFGCGAGRAAGGGVGTPRIDDELIWSTAR